MMVVPKMAGLAEVLQIKPQACTNRGRHLVAHTPMTMYTLRSGQCIYLGFHPDPAHRTVEFPDRAPNPQFPMVHITQQPV
jgi:hypothetical protein